MSQNRLETKTFTAGDRRTSLADTLTDADGDPIDLTGCTVALLAKTAAGVVVINYAAAIAESPATDGKVRYDWGPTNEPPPANKHWYWWRVTKDGKSEHFPGDGEKRQLITVAAP